MRKISLINRILMVLGLVCVSGLSFGSVVFAAEERPEYRLGISPTMKELSELQPGEQYSGSFNIENLGQQDFEYEIAFAPYTVTNEQYNPSFTTENNYTEMKDWISVDAMEGAVAAGSSKEINYTVAVPDGMHGGAQSAAILVTMRNKVVVQDGVETVRQLAYILWGNVDGEVTKTGKILENKIPTFLFNPPIYGTSVVENTGNVYTAAQYTLQVFPLFSDEEVYTNEEKPEDSIIFPETKRMNQIQWEGAPHLGIFKVRQTVKIFDEESVTEKIVFLCPIWFLFIVLLLIFCIIFWLVSRAFRRKKEA